MRSIVAKVTMSRGESLLEMEKIMRGDIRKLFDDFGNPVEVPQLSDNEAARHRSRSGVRRQRGAERMPNEQVDYARCSIPGKPVTKEDLCGS